MINNQDNFNQNDPWWKPAIVFYGKTTSWIILPLLIAVFLGNYATDSLGSQIWIFVAVFIAFLITCLGIYREIKIYQKEVNKENNKEDGDK